MSSYNHKNVDIQCGLHEEEEPMGITKHLNMVYVKKDKSVLAGHNILVILFHTSKGRVFL